MKNYEEVKSYLYGLKYHGAKYGLERMKLLAHEIGHPERRFPVIHVAGTNGKGSTCAMLEAIYRRGGYKTGLFTSPHLVYLGERIQVNRRILDSSAIVSSTRLLKHYAEALAALDPDNHPSFFEFITAMAFMRFSREKIAMGIIETGLGGRRDATNILQPELSIITSISLDHCELLGDSVEKIAVEKAGIIKRGKPVVLGHLPEKAERVIRETARRREAKVYSVGEHFGPDPTAYPLTNLKGSFQRRNAAAALLAANVLRQYPVSEASSRLALQTVNWPGRWDTHFVGSKRLILDTSHNPEGAAMLAENLESLVAEKGRKPIFLVGVLGVFRAIALMPVIARFARGITLLKPLQRHAASFDVLQSAIPSSFSGPVDRSKVKTIFPFPGFCAAGEEGDVIVATGSIYLIGEILEALYHEIPVQEHSLQ